MLKEMKERTYLFIVDIMCEITKGMSYLHDMHIVHRDLKLNNIMINVRDTKVGDITIQHRVVKLIDFGISKVEVRSKQQIGKSLYGSGVYRALEILRCILEEVEVNAFEANVYSFAMVCANILNSNDPFFGICRGKILERVKKGNRPSLLSTKGELKDLIEECWNIDCQQRPKFPEICKRLNGVKKNGCSCKY